MSQRSPLMLPNQLASRSIEANVPSPFVCATVQQTVLKFVEPLDGPVIAAPEPSETLLVAMQRLVDMVNTLRAAPPGSLDSASKQSEDAVKHAVSDTQQLSYLLPYVSEEAYDVLDVLQSEQTRQEQHLDNTTQTIANPSPRQGNEHVSWFQHPDGRTLPSLIPSLSHPLIPSSPQTFVTLEALIPSLLWCLVRSSYSTMQLIEGVRGRCWQAEQGWTSGMLRLVVMLEAETPKQRWRFDIATGYPAENLLEPTAIIQADEPLLTLQQPSFGEDKGDSAVCQVDCQLQTILQSLQAARLGLKPLLQGVAVELLQPESDWQTGHLRLQLGFEFSAQPADSASRDSNTHLHPELIEAELMDEAIGFTHTKASQPVASQPVAESLTSTIAGLRPKPHVSVVTPVGRSLSPNTLMYVTDADRFKRRTPLMTRQQCAQSLIPLQNQQPNGGDERTQLTLIVQAAIAQAHQSDAAGIGLLQPMLLMDELVPKLLWSLTSSTYEIMPLLGGIPAQVLQPYGHWQQGTLRLVAALHLKATDVDYTLDLSTGRSILTNASQLALATIVQTNAIGCAQPMLLETLTAQLQQQVSGAMLEYNLLRDSVAIAWLEDVEQDWQTGSMQLSLSLAFIADAL